MSYFPVTPQSLAAFHSLVAPSSLPYDDDEHQLPPHFRHFDQHDYDDTQDDLTASPSPSCYTAAVVAASTCHPAILVVNTVVEDDSDYESDYLHHNSLHHHDSLVGAPASLCFTAASIKSTSVSVSSSTTHAPSTAATSGAPARRVHSMPLLHSQLTSSPASASSSSSSSSYKLKFGHAVSAPISIPTSSVNYHAYSPSCRAAANVCALASSSDNSMTPPRPFIHRRDRDIPYACRRSNYHTASFVEQKDRFILDGADVATSHQHDDQLVNEEKTVEQDDEYEVSEEESLCNAMDGLFVCEEDLVPSVSISASNDEYLVSSRLPKKQQLRQAAHQRLHLFPL